MTIPDRPMICIDRDVATGDILISATKIADDRDSVEGEQVVIPFCDLQQVIQALQGLCADGSKSGCEGG